MTFQSLHQVLNAIETQEEWKGRQQLQHIRTCWLEIVGRVVSDHTRPIAIQREVLQVATSGSAWAQTLSFERHRILLKLNSRVSSSLTDIHFSTAHWHTPISQSPQSSDLEAQHPSWIGSTKRSPRPQAPQTATAAFHQWATLVQERSNHLPLCPTCQCPTPPGELQRWAVCAICTTTKSTAAHPDVIQE